MELLIKGTQFILSLSILVLIHEFGHFAAAKLTKTKVEKFYLFFNPWFTPFKIKKGETEYGIGWLPLGGFVKISGMVDESLDKEQLKKPPEPYEYRSKNTLQKVFIITAGVILNFFLAVFIFFCFSFFVGDTYTVNKSLKNGLYFNEDFKKLGFKNGDNISKINDVEITYFEDIFKNLLLNDSKKVEVLRNGEYLTIELPNDFDEKVLNMNKEDLFFAPILPFTVDKINPNSYAESMGLKENDMPLLIDNTDISIFQVFQKELSKNINKNCTLSVLRNNDTVKLNMTVPGNGKLGFYSKINMDDIKTDKIKKGFFESIGNGFNSTINFLSMQIKGLMLLFKPKVKVLDNMGGLISIGNIFSSVWDWGSFWRMTALLSTLLAFMNILPIPGLDGGHFMIALIEGIIGKQINTKYSLIIQNVGMLILISLMLIVNLNDIYKFVILPFLK